MEGYESPPWDSGEESEVSLLDFAKDYESPASCIGDGSENSSSEFMASYVSIKTSPALLSFLNDAITRLYGSFSYANPVRRTFFEANSLSAIAEEQEILVPRVLASLVRKDYTPTIEELKSLPAVFDIPKSLQSKSCAVYLLIVEKDEETKPSVYVGGASSWSEGARPRIRDYETMKRRLMSQSFRRLVFEEGHTMTAFVNLLLFPNEGDEQKCRSAHLTNALESVFMCLFRTVKTYPSPVGEEFGLCRGAREYLGMNSILSLCEANGLPPDEATLKHRAETKETKRESRREYVRKWWADQPEEQKKATLEQKRKQNGKESTKATKKVWNLANREKTNAKERDRHRRNGGKDKGKVAEYSKTYREKHKEKIAADKKAVAAKKKAEKLEQAAAKAAKQKQAAAKAFGMMEDSEWEASE